MDRLFNVLETTGRVDGLDLKVRKKGSESDCVLAADTVTIQDNACYLFVLMDITERKRSELELVEAIETVMQDASWFSQTLIEKLANAKRVLASLINTPRGRFSRCRRRSTSSGCCASGARSCWLPRPSREWRLRAH